MTFATSAKKKTSMKAMVNLFFMAIDHGVLVIHAVQEIQRCPRINLLYVKLPYYFAIKSRPVRARPSDHGPTYGLA